VGYIVYGHGSCHDATFSRLQRPCRVSDGACGKRAAPHSTETCKIGERMHAEYSAAKVILHETLVLRTRPRRGGRARARAIGGRRPTRAKRGHRGVHDVRLMGHGLARLGDPCLCAPLSCLQLLLHVHLCGCPLARGAGSVPLLIAPRSPRVLHDAPPEWPLASP
jgi:hypothetical protein